MTELAALHCRGDDCPRCRGALAVLLESRDDLAALLTSGHPVQVPAERVEDVRMWIALRPELIAAGVEAGGCLRFGEQRAQRGDQRWRVTLLRRAAAKGAALRWLGDGAFTSSYLQVGAGRVVKAMRSRGGRPRVTAAHHAESLRLQERLRGLPGLILGEPCDLAPELVTAAEPLAAGPSLGRTRSLGPEAVLAIGRRAAWIVVAIHEAGLVHGGLHASRIHVHDGGISVRGACGPLVAFRRDPAPVTSLEDGGNYLGVPDYTPPEARSVFQVGWERTPPAPAEDVFCLAAALRKIAGGPGTYADLRSALAGEVTRWEDRSPLARVIESALAADPAARPSARALAQSLDALPG